MELDLYSKDGAKYRSIANWHPDEQQWWITAFNAAPEEWLPDVDDLYVIEKICFEEATDNYGNSVDLTNMYFAFKSRMIQTNTNDYDATIIFDDSIHCVYIFWGRNVYGKAYA